MKKAAVFVYGDIGRSPRMQNHAQQLSNNYQVTFFGYFDSSPKQSIINNQNIHLVDLQIKNLQFIRKISFYLYALIRIILQVLQILYLLGFKHKNFQFILIQNPPSIPNLFAIWLASFLGKYEIYIDFHNYGYTILQLNVKNRYIIKMAKLYEVYFGRKAKVAFCVSEKMKEDLKENWNINAITLYDRPLKQAKFQFNKNVFMKKYNLPELDQNQLLIVSSTSWTKDEDFSILLDALQLYEESQSKRKIIRALITGKGPQKQKYLSIIKQREPKWSKISIKAVWLQADDYPVLLSMCDLGVCLHYSSSGLDLPMKVVDMFGAGIPVLAIHYKALQQLLKDGTNGFVFHSTQDLATQLMELSRNQTLLKKLKGGAQKQQAYTWNQQWRKKFKIQ